MDWKKLKRQEKTWKKVAAILGVHTSTLYRWRKGLSKGHLKRNFSDIKGRKQLFNVQEKIKKKKSIKKYTGKMDVSRMVYLPKTKSPIGINRAKAQYKKLLKGKVSDEKYKTYVNGVEETTSLQEDIIKYRDKLLRGRMGCKVTLYGVLDTKRGKEIPLADIHIRNLLLEDSTWIVRWWEQHYFGTIGILLSRFKDYAQEQGSYVVDKPMIRIDTNTKVVVNHVDMVFSFQ